MPHGAAGPHAGNPNGRRLLAWPGEASRVAVRPTRPGGRRRAPGDRDAPTTQTGSLLLAGVVKLAEEDPALAVELRELLLLDRGVIGRAGVDLDARQQQRELDVLQTRRLLHDVLAAQVVSRLLQHVHHRLGDRVAEGVELVVERAVGI